MLDIKEYLKQTKTVLLTQDAFDELMQRASAQPEKRTQERTETHVVCLDTIERHAAIDAHYEYCNKHPDAGFPVWSLKILEDLPSAQPEPQWIPCSEKLPEANGRYLVTRGLVAAGALWNRVYIANYSNLMGIKSVKIWWQGNVGKSDFERLDDVFAWQPLPEPCREGES